VAIPAMMPVRRSSGIGPIRLMRLAEGLTGADHA
jgi:hypothetical protein